MGQPVSLTDQNGVYIDPRGSSASPNVQRSQGAPTLATGQASVTTASATVVPARAGRATVTLINESTTVVRYGPAGVSTANGAYLAGTVGASVTLHTTAAIAAIVATGTAAVSFVETF